MVLLPLKTDKTYQLAVCYDAVSGSTKVYVDGVEDASGSANVREPYELAALAADARNYIGRTQWWDTSYAGSNVDFCGTIDNFTLYNIALSRKEICALQGIKYEEKNYTTTLVNGDFEATYSILSGSGVTADRAIYMPEGWTADYALGDANDLTALKSGDYYFADFFLPANS